VCAGIKKKKIYKKYNGWKYTKGKIISVEVRTGQEEKRKGGKRNDKVDQPRRIEIMQTS
jgi:hypothetical protein